MSPRRTASRSIRSRARTYINLGIVLVGGYKDREQAIKMFREGLQISPEIRLSRALANPQIQEVFDEAVRRLSSEPASSTPAPPPSAAIALPAENSWLTIRFGPGCAAPRSPSPSRRTPASANVP